jgi:hypothetical protein
MRSTSGDGAREVGCVQQSRQRCVQHWWGIAVDNAPSGGHSTRDARHGHNGAVSWESNAQGERAAGAGACRRQRGVATPAEVLRTHQTWRCRRGPPSQTPSRARRRRTNSTQHCLFCTDHRGTHQHTRVKASSACVRRALHQTVSRATDAAPLRTPAQQRRAQQHVHATYGVKTDPRTTDATSGFTAVANTSASEA